jgi:hypothetical protein
MAEEKEYAISLRMDYNVFSFDKFKKEYDDKNGTIKWFFLDNRDIKVGDIVYIYCSNMPDLVNRFIIKANVCEVVNRSKDKDTFDKIINEYISNYDLDKDDYKSYITLNTIEYLNSKDIYDFSTDRLKNKYKKEYGGFQGRSGKISNDELLDDLSKVTCTDIQIFLDKWVDSDCFFHDIKLRIDSVVDQDRYNIHPVFVKDNGIKYVEYHHLIFRNKSYGIDSNSRIHELINKEYNYLRLCPSCHRMIHYGSSSIRKQMIDAICKKHVPNNREGLEEILNCLKIKKSVEDYLYEIYDINK